MEWTFFANSIAYYMTNKNAYLSYQGILLFQYSGSFENKKCRTISIYLQFIYQHKKHYKNDDAHNHLLNYEQLENTDKAWGIQYLQQGKQNKSPNGINAYMQINMLKL